MAVTAYAAQDRRLVAATQSPRHARPPRGRGRRGSLRHCGGPQRSSPRIYPLPRRQLVHHQESAPQGNLPARKPLRAGRGDPICGPWHDDQPRRQTPRTILRASRHEIARAISCEIARQTCSAVSRTSPRQVTYGIDRHTMGEIARQSRRTSIRAVVHALGHAITSALDRTCRCALSHAHQHGLTCRLAHAYEYALCFA